MRERSSRLAAVAVAVAVPLVCAAADHPPAPVFPAHLNEVHLTVTVQDAAGRLVPDLKMEDFEVSENGRPQKIQLFGRAVEQGQEDRLALDVGLLLDTSGSMITQLKLSQAAAVSFLESIPRAHDLLAIFFDSDIRVSHYSSENQQGLFDQIANAKAGGNTALYDAISVYLSRVQDSTGRKVLVLFTDGEDYGSALSLPQTLELLRASGAVAYPIAFTGGFAPGSTRGIQARLALAQMADQTGGRVFIPRTFRDLGPIYDRILSELRAQYVLGYVSDDASHDGRFRRLKVEVSGKGLRVRHRAGYYAG
jgi:Ca-activated chloride channel family protein